MEKENKITLDCIKTCEECVERFDNKSKQEQKIADSSKEQIELFKKLLEK